MCADVILDDGSKHLTVAELIAELQKMPQDALVWHEGCDCFGEANGVRKDKDGTVTITRP